MPKVALITLLGTGNKFDNRVTCAKKARGCTLSAIHTAAANSKERSVLIEHPENGQVASARIFDGVTPPWGNDKYEIISDAIMHMFDMIVDHDIHDFHFNGHSRGAVQSIFIANTIKKVKDNLNSDKEINKIEDLFTGCNSNIATLLINKFKAKYKSDAIHTDFSPENKEDIIKLRESFNKITMNIFAIDPVAGDAYLNTVYGSKMDVWTWKDPECFTIPGDIVRNYHQILAIHERSQCFTALYPTVEGRTVENTGTMNVSVELLPGNHCSATGILTTQSPVIKKISVTDGTTSSTKTVSAPRPIMAKTTGTSANATVEVASAAAAASPSEYTPVDTSCVQDYALCRLAYFMLRYSGITRFNPEQIDEKDATHYHPAWRQVGLKSLKDVLRDFLSITEIPILQQKIYDHRDKIEGVRHIYERFISKHVYGLGPFRAHRTVISSDKQYRHVVHQDDNGNIVKKTIDEVFINLHKIDSFIDSVLPNSIIISKKAMKIGCIVGAVVLAAVGTTFVLYFCAPTIVASKPVIIAYAMQHHITAAVLISLTKVVELASTAYTAVYLDVVVQPLISAIIATAKTLALATTAMNSVTSAGTAVNATVLTLASGIATGVMATGLMATADYVSEAPDYKP